MSLGLEGVQKSQRITNFHKLNEKSWGVVRREGQSDSETRTEGGRVVAKGWREQRSIN